MKICMNWIKALSGLLGRTLLIWLTLDFFAGNYILSISGLAKNTGGGVKHDVYHHDLKPSFSGKAGWGYLEYEICTNEFGFRDKCEQDAQIKSKELDVAFLGDSFTQGVGIDWDKTYVGLASLSLNKMKVANLGVSSYAPSIYYSKLKYLLNEGFQINDLVVALDISDISDEARRYVLLEDGTVKDRKEPRTLDQIKKFNEWAFPFTYRLNRLYRDFKKQSVHKVKTVKEMHRMDNPQYAWTYNDYPAEEFYGFVSSREALDISRKHMTMLSNLAKANNIRLHLMVYPWPAQILYDNVDTLQSKFWKEFCNSNCYEFIDTFPDFFAEAKHVGKENFVESMYIPNDVHFNEEGNEFLFRSLKRNSKLFSK